MNEDDYEDERRRYQWHRGYSRHDEYPKDPDWADEISVEETGDDDEDDAFGRTVRFFDVRDPEHKWVSSDEVRNLVRCR